MCTNQGNISSLLQCIVSLVNASHSGKTDFSEVYWCFFQGMPWESVSKTKEWRWLLIYFVLSWWAAVWHTAGKPVRNHSSALILIFFFFELFSALLRQSWFPLNSFGVLYWAHDQSTRVTCSRTQSSTRNSWCVFVRLPSPWGDECAQPNVFLWNYF